MVLETEVAVEGLGILGFVEECLHLVYRSELHLHIRLSARLLCPLMEHVTDMLWLDVHLQGVLTLVHHHLRCVALGHHRLEIGICGFLRDTAVLRTAA